MLALELARQSGSSVLSAVRPMGRAVKMRAILAQPRTSGGQLYAARRDHLGHFQTCARPLSYFDTSSGRYLATEHDGVDGTRWRTLVPADQALLVRRLDGLLPR
jgi:hypothetical protein